MGADGGISPWLGGFGSASQGQEGRKRCCGVWFVVVCWLAGWLAAQKETSHTMPNDNDAKRNETYLGHGFTHAHTQLGADVGELIALIEQKRCLDLANHHDELLLV